ncbi:hypothetical protein YQE_07544, partial [Dendroctonus ponderosae]
MKRLIPDIQPNRKRMNSRNGNNRGHHSGHFYNISGTKHGSFIQSYILSKFGSRKPCT